MTPTKVRGQLHIEMAFSSHHIGTWLLITPMIFSIFKLFLNIHTHHQLLFILGPVTGFVSVHYSFKWCTVIGGLLAGLGMTMSSLTTSVELLLLTYSFVMGMVTNFKAPITD